MTGRGHRLARRGGADSYLALIARLPLARISERAIHADLAADGFSILDRELSTLEPIKKKMAADF